MREADKDSFSIFLSVVGPYVVRASSWRGRKISKIGIHLTENGSNQRHVIFDGC